MRVTTKKQAVVTGTPTARSHAHDAVTQSTGFATRRTSASRTQGAPVSDSNTHKQRQTQIHRHPLKTHTFTFTLAKCVGIACTYIHHDSWTDGGPAHTHTHTSTQDDMHQTHTVSQDAASACTQ